MSIIQGNSIESGVSSYQIERSLRFNSADSAYLDRSIATSGNLRKWTVSCWVKRSVLSGSADRYLFTETNEDGSGADIKYTIMRFTTADKLELADRWASAGDEKITTTAVFRDPSAWYHVVFVRDSDNATATDRAIIYVNGVRQAVTGSFTQSKDSSWNKQTTAAYGQEVSGRFRFAGSWYYGSDFYLTEVHSIDGQALDPTSFGEYNTDTGVWQPIAYTGSYGTNGFYLDFADNSNTTALGYDAAGSNDWTPNNFSVTAGAGNDSLVDTPTPYGTDTGVGGEVRGNYCTWNSAAQSTVVNGTVTRSNGNLESTDGSTTYGLASFGTIAVSSGKWYWEIVTSAAGGTTGNIGVVLLSSISGSTHSGQFYQMAGYLNSAASNTNTSAYGASYTVGDVIGVALDMDAGTVTFYKNGTSQGQAASGLSGYYSPAVGDGQNAASYTFVANFGQRPFAYTAPSGFKALCTQNLPEPTVVDGGEYFQAVPYQGNSSTQTISGVGFQPDFTWLKGRSYAGPHKLFDAVRGATKSLSSNLTDAEVTDSDALTAFTSDGFSLGADGDVNRSADGGSHISWNWKANGAGVSNTDGTITSTVSANTTAGFSIVTWAGNSTNASTIGHGLGVAPSLLITKSRTNASSWVVGIGGMSGFGVNDYLVLQTTSGKGSSSTFYQAYGADTFTVGVSAADEMNKTGNNYVTYAFTPVEGYSAFGSYTGNGSTDGPFVYTGFRPAFVMVKQTSASGQEWCIQDNKRLGYNPDNAALFADLSSAEYASNLRYVDFTSNGFKIRNSTSNQNGSGATYIYMAFAETPFSLSLAR